MNLNGAVQRFVPLVIASAATTLSPADAPKLKVGSVAPPVKVSAWMQGTPVKSFEKGKVYVVEFWATWCGPCVESMPHLTKLATRYKGKATFTGVDVWEDTPGSKVSKAVPAVKKFLKDNPGRIGYNVAVDGKAAFMATNWLQAAGQDGIPCAFIVDQHGKIAWIGHPMDGLEDVLPKVIANKFDPVAYAKSRPKAENAQPDFDPLMSAISGKDFAGIIKAVDKMQKQDPKFGRFLEPYRTAAIAGTDLPAATAIVEKLIADKKDEDVRMTGVAMLNIEDQPKDYYRLAIKALEAPPVLQNDDALVSYEGLLGRAYAKVADPAKAIEHYQRAIDAGKRSKTPAALLKMYQDELEKAKQTLPPVSPQG